MDKISPAAVFVTPGKVKGRLKKNQTRTVTTNKKNKTKTTTIRNNEGGGGD